MGAAVDGPWWAEESSRARVIADSMEIRQRDIRTMKELRKMLVGPEYGGGVVPEDQKSPTNSVYGFVSRMEPPCLGGEIKPLVDTDHGSPEESVALAYEQLALEGYRRGGGRSVLELVHKDMACGYGGLMIRPGKAQRGKLLEEDRAGLRMPLGPNPWTEKQRSVLEAEEKPLVNADPRQPEIHYLPPDAWGWDRRAFTPDHAEFYYYETVHDVHELMERAKDESTGWMLDKLRYAADKMSTADEQPKTGGTGTRSQHAANVDRRRITLLTVIALKAEIDGQKKPKHHSGVVYTMWAPNGSPESAIDVKEPAYNFGPPFGNFVCFAQHLVGEDSLPYSVLTANMEKMRAADAMHAVTYRKIKEHRKAYAADARLKKSVEKLEEVQDGEIALVPNLGEFGGLTEYERGGIDAATVAAMQYIDGQLAQDLGLDPAGRGAAQGNGTTATETALANEQADAYGRQFQQAFNRGVARMFKILGWYAGHDAQFMVPADYANRAKFHELEAIRGGATPEEAAVVGRRAAKGDAREGFRRVNQGGDFAEFPGLDFEALRWRVDIHAQRPKGEQERRIESAQFRADLAQVLQMAIQLPVYDWVAELRQLEEDYGRRGIVEQYEPQIASAMAQVQIEGGAPQAGVVQPGDSQRVGASGGVRATIVPGASNRQSRIQPQPQQPQPMGQGMTQ